MGNMQLTRCCVHGSIAALVLCDNTGHYGSGPCNITTQLPWAHNVRHHGTRIPGRIKNWIKMKMRVE